MENEHRALPPFDTRPASFTFLPSLCFRFSLFLYAKEKDLTGWPWKPSTKLRPTATGVSFGAFTVAHRRREPKKYTDDV